MSQRAQMTRRALTVAAAAVVLAVAAGGTLHILADRSVAAGQAPPHVSARMVERRYDFPLKPSSNRRYLVDQRNVPFMIVGDSPQALIGNLSVADAAVYIADRKAAGFNSLWVDLLCATYTGCRADGKTFDGIAPFTTPGDLSTPNPAYFARADAMIRLAAKAGIVVFLDPIETGGWLGVLRSERSREGPRLRSVPRSQVQELPEHRVAERERLPELAQPVRRCARPGRRAAASGRPTRSTSRRSSSTTSESGSLDDPRWRSVIQLDAAYTYYPTYARVLREYDRKPPPAGLSWWRRDTSSSRTTRRSRTGDPPILRRQEYWSMLSGATGQFYGNHYTWQFADGWKDHLDTPGSAQLGYLVRLFTGLPWFRLVPDQAHRIVTAGYGTFTATGNVGVERLRHDCRDAGRDARRLATCLPAARSR